METSDQPPEIPDHPAVTRRLQFTVKNKIKEERASKKASREAAKASQEDTGDAEEENQGKRGKGKGKGKGKKNKTSKRKDKKTKEDNTKKNKSKVKAVKVTQEEKQDVKEKNKVAKAKGNDESSSKAGKNENKSPAGSKKNKESKCCAPGPKSTSKRIRHASDLEEIDHELKQTLVETLKVCGGHDQCTEECHEFSRVVEEGVGESVYWKNNAVGVLLDNRYMDIDADPNKKRMKHVAYFGSGDCTQCNFILANKWVTCQIMFQLCTSTLFYIPKLPCIYFLDGNQIYTGSIGGWHDIMIHVWNIDSIYMLYMWSAWGRAPLVDFGWLVGGSPWRSHEAARSDPEVNIGGSSEGALWMKQSMLKIQQSKVEFQRPSHTAP